MKQTGEALLEWTLLVAVLVLVVTAMRGVCARGYRGQREVDGGPTDRLNGG